MAGVGTEGTKNIKHLNMQEVCRTCAKTFDESILIPAFDQIEITAKTNSNFQLSNELISLNIHIKKDDGLPQQVCINCVRHLTNIFTFRQMCSESQIELKELFLDNSSPSLTNDVEETQPLEIVKLPLYNKMECNDSEAHVPISNDDNVTNDLKEDNISSDEEDEIIDSETDARSDTRIDLKNEAASIIRRKDMISFNFDEILKRRNHVGVISYNDNDTMGDITSDNNIPANSGNRMDTREVSIILRRVDSKKFSQLPSIKTRIRNSTKEQLDREKDNILFPHSVTKCCYCKKYIYTSRYEIDAKICSKLQKINKLETVSPSEFCCFYCDDKFKSQEIIKEHILKLHPIKIPFLCKLCNEYFPSIYSRKLHNGQAHNKDYEKMDSKAPTCDVCGLKFVQKHRALKHKRIVHPDGNIYECEICSKKFNNEYKFNYHLKSHDKSKQFKCRYCEKTFMQMSHRIYHEETHTNQNKPFKCEECGRSFVHRCKYKIHLRTHEGDMPHICDVCGKGFPSENLLILHKYCHSNDFQCEFCGEILNSKGEFKLHKASHKDKGKRMHSPTPRTSLKNSELYICPITACSRQFVIPSALEKHMRVHDKNRKYKCDICQCTYKASNHLKDHINRAHSKAKCFTCPICGKSFFDSFYLNFHVKSHTEKHKCSYCNNLYSKQYIKIHERSHLNQKNYPCMICGKGFYHNTALRTHYSRHTPEEMRDIEAKILADNKESLTTIESDVINLTQ